MITFGKHKGKSLKEVIQTNIHYVYWLYTHQMLLKHELDDDDKQTYFYVFNPLVDIDGYIDELITKLKERGLLKHIEYDDNRCIIESVYAKEEMQKENLNTLEVYWAIRNHFINHTPSPSPSDLI
jgi:hypothetical protein